MVGARLATILFGTAGSGKSFLGELIESRLGMLHYELDQHLTPAMQSAISNGREFTDEMRDEYFVYLVPYIKDILKAHPRCVFTQAVYKERHRRYLVEQIPELEPVWITAPLELIAERLMAREEGISSDYARKIQANFEPPMGGKTLVNDSSDTELLCQRFVELFPNRGVSR